MTAKARNEIDSAPMTEPRVKNRSFEWQAPGASNTNRS
jgi:hypothetical protein